MSICLRTNRIREDVHHDGDTGEEDPGITACIIYIFQASTDLTRHIGGNATVT